MGLVEQRAIHFMRSKWYVRWFMKLCRVYYKLRYGKNFYGFYAHVPILKTDYLINEEVTNDHK